MKKFLGVLVAITFCVCMLVPAASALDASSLTDYLAGVDFSTLSETDLTALLGDLGLEDFDAAAIINGDEKTITVAQGIGKRIAQRVILELKDKISKESAEIVSSGVVPVIATGGAATKHSEASAALAVLGFTPAEAAAVLKTIDIDKLSIEDIIREALAKSLK